MLAPARNWMFEDRVNCSIRNGGRRGVGKVELRDAAAVARPTTDWETRGAPCETTYALTDHLRFHIASCLPAPYHQLLDSQRWKC